VKRRGRKGETVRSAKNDNERDEVKIYGSAQSPRAKPNKGGEQAEKKKNGGK